MAIIIDTSKPRELLASVKKAIDEGKVTTWSYDSEGDFTHTPDQWKGKAWLRPKIASSILTFGLLGNKDVIMTKTVYGVYHGRFIEMMLTHFDNDFSEANATAHKKADVDRFKTAS